MDKEVKVVRHEAVCDDIDSGLREIMIHLLQEELKIPPSSEYFLLIVPAIVNVIEMIRKDLDRARSHGSPQGWSAKDTADWLYKSSPYTPEVRVLSR